MRLSLRLVTLFALVAAPLQAAENLEFRAELPVPESLLARAEALTQTDTAAIFDAALASIGCAIPTDLVSVFDIYLVDYAMLYLGAPVGAEVAQQGFFALRLHSDTIHHEEARAVLAAARAMEGILAQRMRLGELPQSLGLFRAEDCEATGTIFNLAPYARE